MLTDLGVSALWVDGRCRYFAYSRGVFSTTPDSDVCAVDGIMAARGFDLQADLDLQTLLAWYQERDLPIVYISVKRDERGEVAAQSFFNADECQSFVFEPGWTALPGDLLEEAVAVDANWYLILSCQ